MESARGESGLGITLSYWDSLEAISHWKRHAEHQLAQKEGREVWYSHYEVRIAKVERAYGMKPEQAEKRRCQNAAAACLKIVSRYHSKLMKILLTGSSGWLGIHLHPMLKHTGYEPIGLDPVNGPCTEEVGSVADAELLRSLFKRHRFDGVIHAGALHKPDIVRNPRQAFIDVNLTGTLNLLEAAVEHGISRFFPEEDDTHRDLSGPNLKANEILHRRASVEDMARAHVIAMERAPDIGFGLFIVSAPTPFLRSDVNRLKCDARAVISEKFPEADDLYRKHGWKLPTSIGRVYDGTLITRKLDFSYKTTFADVLHALRKGTALPFAHDASYLSPLVRKQGDGMGSCLEV